MDETKFEISMKHLDGDASRQLDRKVWNSKVRSGLMI